MVRGGEPGNRAQDKKYSLYARLFLLVLALVLAAVDAVGIGRIRRRIHRVPVDRHIGALVARGGVVFAPRLELVLALVLVRRDDRLADVFFRLHVAAAGPARRQVRIADAIVDGLLRERARHARAPAARGGDGVGRDAVLDPVHHLLEHALLIRLRSRPAAAMRDAGHAEEIGRASCRARWRAREWA